MSVLSICLMIRVVIPFLPRWRPSGRHKGYISHQHCKAQTSTCTQSFTRKLSYDMVALHPLIVCSLLCLVTCLFAACFVAWYIHLIGQLSQPHRLEDQQARDGIWIRAQSPLGWMVKERRSSC